MRVEFQCTFDDFVEAGIGRPPRRRSWRTVAGLFGWLFFLGLVIAFYLLFRSSNEASDSDPKIPAALPEGHAITVRFLIASAVSFLCIGGFSLLLVYSLRARPKPQWSVAPVSRFRWRAIFVGIVGGIIVSKIFLVSSGRIDSAMVPSGYETLLSITPCLLLMLISTGFASVHARHDRKRRWEALSVFHRPHTIEANLTGVTIEEPLGSQRYRWECFCGYKETTNVLLLYFSIYSFLIIPKRNFTPDDLEAVKALLMTHIKEGTLLPIATGFPVSALPVPLAPGEKELDAVA